jgi:DNA-binding LytR/AlgR family response regulator
VESLALFVIYPDHPFTMRESPYIKSLPRCVPHVLVLAAVMAVAGPFGTYEHMGFGTRLIYFAALGMLNWLQVALLAAWFGNLEPIDRWSVTGRMILTGMLAAVPGTMEIFVLTGWMSRPIPLFQEVVAVVFLENAFLTIVIAIVIGLVTENSLRESADRERNRVAALVLVTQPTANGLDFFRRVPPALGSDLLALEMEDHYLRIHTALGSDLVLLRLRDAVAELGPARGRQVHRSWWVAEGAVVTAERNGSRTLLVLRNGLKVPISKSFRSDLKEAGWL